MGHDQIEGLAKELADEFRAKCIATSALEVACRELLIIKRENIILRRIADRCVTTQSAGYVRRKPGVPAKMSKHDLPDPITDEWVKSGKEV